MNFNFSKKPEYELNCRCIDEVIKLYGLEVKFVFTNKIFSDDKGVVFRDFKTLKGFKSFSNDQALYKKLYVLPADTEQYNNGLQNMFNNFGLINDDTMQVFVSLRDLDFLNTSEDGTLIHPKFIISNLLIMPNDKVMEITDCQLHVEGVNNYFTYSDIPSAYKLSLKSYNFDNGASNVIKNPTPIPQIDNFLNKVEKLKDENLDYSTKETIINKCGEDRLERVKIKDIFKIK